MIFVKTPTPVFAGPLGIVGDPSVIRDGNLLRMVYSSYDVENKRLAITGATSKDGRSWLESPTGDATMKGRLFKTVMAPETPFLIKRNGLYWCYFIAYTGGDYLTGTPAQIWLATSTDGVHYSPPAKVMDPDPDEHTLTSPSVVAYRGGVVMLYSSFKADAAGNLAVSIKAATSLDGRKFTKSPQILLSKANFPEAKDGISECEMRQSPDGLYRLAYTLLYDKGHDIGMASAPTPFGPFSLNHTPIIKSNPASGFDQDGAVAPTILFDGGLARCWFHGNAPAGVMGFQWPTIEIGYAESPYP